MNIVISALISIGVFSTILSILSNFDWHLEGLLDTIAGAIINIIWVFMGAYIATAIYSIREPDIDIVVDDSYNTDSHYADGQHWKFFRVKVINRALPVFFKYVTPFITRYPATGMRATIEFVQQKQIMKGRWSSSMELPSSLAADYIHLANVPDTVTIGPGEVEALDVMAKYQYDSEAYGWSNESFLHAWRTPGYRLNTGDWEAIITVESANGARATRSFMLHIAPTIENTYVSQLR